MNLVTAVAWVAAASLSASLFSHTVAVRLLLLLLGAGLAVIAVSRRRADIRFLPQIWLPFVLWAAWAAVSLAWSVEPERTLKELRNEVGYTGLALWICFVGAQANNAVRIFLPVVGAAAAAAIAIALRDFSIGWERYLVGLHGGPGDHSSALLTLMPCVAMAGWYGWRAKWPLHVQLSTWTFAPLVLLSAYFTLNRTIWLGLAVQFMLLGILILVRSGASASAPWSTRAKLFGAAFALAIVAGTYAVLLAIQGVRGRAFVDDSRLALWPEILEQVGERPLTGYGFGRGLLRGPLRAELGGLDGNLWHAHNIFLEVLLQLGVPGLALLLLLLGALVRQGWRLTRHMNDASAACGIALIAVVGGMLVRNMTDSLLQRQNALFFWGVVGVLLALGSTSHRQSTRRAE